MRKFILVLAAAALLTGASRPPKTPAKPQLEGVITEEDYPSSALRREEQGKVRIRIDVSKTGAVAGCTVVASSGSAALDETTCRLFRSRARFTPARDRRGRAVADTWSTTIEWRITQENYNPAVDLPTNDWTTCLTRAFAPLLPGPATREEVADKAFAACAKEEDEMRSAIMAAHPGDPPFTSENARRSFRPVLLRLIDEARTGVRI